MSAGDTVRVAIKKSDQNGLMGGLCVIGGYGLIGGQWLIGGRGSCSNRTASAVVSSLSA